MLCSTNMTPRPPSLRSRPLTGAAAGPAPRKVTIENFLRIAQLRDLPPGSGATRFASRARWRTGARRFGLAKSVGCGAGLFSPWDAGLLSPSGITVRIGGGGRSARQLRLGEALPGGVVVRLGVVERELRRPVWPAAFHHEGQGAVELVRRQLGLARRLPAGGIGAVAGHQIVEAHPARREALGLGVVGARDQPHALAHHVAVEPGRAERV